MKGRTFFKTLVIVMILMLLAMTFGTYSYAVDQNATGTITVSNLEPGANVSIYKLTDVHIASNGQPESTPYTWADGIDEVVGKDYTVEDFYNYYNENKDNPQIEEEIQLIYDNWASRIRSRDISATETKKVEGEPEYDPEIVADQTVTFENCEMGTYMILVENGYRVYAPAVVNLTPEFVDGEWVLNNATQDIVLKSSTPSITKTVTDETLKKDNYGTNDEIQFTIIADMPKLQGFPLQFWIGDKFANGTIDMDSFEVYGVKGSTQDKLSQGDQYDVFIGNYISWRPMSLIEEQVADIDLDFTIEISSNVEMANYDQIKIIYKASLIRDATPVSVNMGAEGNKNNAYLIYKNNPYDHSSWQIQESSTTVYTYGIEISKVDKDGGTLLPGAKFEVLNNEGDGAYFYCSEPGKYNFYSPYEVAMSIDTTNEEGYVTNVLEVDDQGKLYLYGLDAGTYKLQEIEAPDGYNLATEPITIEIVDNDLDGKLDGNKEDGTEIDPNGTGIYTITVENSKGFQLPVTGGIGTVVFAATGIVVVGLGMTLLMIVFKKNRAAK